ncbi:hypothetical protein N7448_004874 [Penicillium atrosanguineum]|uniref:uncharacterized protein n=1 Tax=Penicillium atrosanguineum TaxID=1132637 RepID=UPI00239D3E57|nr:uncharacterized protein N7443_008624 [Penicillium atrosanguineum]KAJ5125555.1 hypothetical protein N7526_007732 [Penicillium atrosanguineum]KAJ5136320.1 hypothetical protein N7448_004874 [Penicillium atrosanguineum]KAJ5292671.1 hypothetical protein N7443_008624 [Penicillium atrosanguineum]
MASPTRETSPSFIQQRDMLFTQLNEQSVILKKSPEQYLVIADALDDLAQKIASFKLDAHSPLCFSAKYDALATTLLCHSDVLKSHPSRHVEIAASIDLMQLRLGRLTMKLDRDNDFALKMDALASRMETSWMPSDGMDGMELAIKEHLHRVWWELNLKVPGCECGNGEKDEKRALDW